MTHYLGSVFRLLHGLEPTQCQMFSIQTVCWKRRQQARFLTSPTRTTIVNLALKSSRSGIESIFEEQENKEWLPFLQHHFYVSSSSPSLLCHKEIEGKDEKGRRPSFVIRRRYWMIIRNHVLLVPPQFIQALVFVIVLSNICQLTNSAIGILYEYNCK